MTKKCFSKKKIHGMADFGLEGKRRNYYYPDMVFYRLIFSIYYPICCFFATALLLTSALGCRLASPIKPLTPSQFRSGELSRVGNAAMEKGNWEEAEKKLEEAVRLNKKDAELRRHYAEALWNRGKQDESLSQLTEAIKRSGSENASLYISLTEKYLAMDDPLTAEQYAEESVRRAPQDHKAWFLRGKVNRHLGETERKKAIQAQSLDQTETTVSFSQQSKQHLIQAKNDFYRALSFANPLDCRDILPELAAVQMRCEQPNQALASWQNLQELFPPDAIPTDLLRGKAEAYIAMSRFDDAMTCLRTAQRQEPHQIEIAQRLQEILQMAQHQSTANYK